jgi:DNA-binding NtrC family response regulator
VDVRIVATTNRNLADEVAAGRFRRDLFYRLSVVPIRTPALRERLEDVPLLVTHFAQAAAEQLGIKPPEVPMETIEHLRRRRWPGNVRELANAVERAVILSRGGRLVPESFETPAGMRPSEGEGHPPSPAETPAVAGLAELPINLDALERIAIERALKTTQGHRARAAALLGISERTLRNKLNVR